MTNWSNDDGLRDVSSSFQGITSPISEIYDDIHRRGWTVNKLHIKDEQYVAEGKNPHGETVEAYGRTDATAAANLLVKIMRREFMRGGSLRAKVGAWDHRPIESQLSVIAQAYVDAPIYDPKAASSWMELAQDCQRRAQIIEGQLSVEYTDDPIPYGTADEMREDVTQKKHIMVTRASPHHPVWNEQQMLDYRLVVDVLGHTIGGADWGWHGTCLAFASLAPQFAESPQKALFTELVGQTAFGTVYRQWGAQKIAFLDDLIEKAQEDENSPGHTGVHPSQSLVPGLVPHIGAVVGVPSDPNADWQSGIQPLQDAAYLWQGDPLNSQGVSDSLRPLEMGLARVHPDMAKQAVVNALRGSLLGARKNPQAHAVHYQSLMNLPAEVDDPMAYQDALEQQRENWNQSHGYAPHSHRQYWPEEQQFKQWVKATNPHLDDGSVQRLAKRELLHMLTEEEERIIANDPSEEMNTELIEHEAYEAMRKRLKGLTKPSVDQKVDFGEDHLWHESTHHADMYPPYLASHLRPIAAASHHAKSLTEAAREDLVNHKGSGHHFRSAALSLGIPGLGPRQASNAWLHLAPQTSQLGIINPQLMETLGHDYLNDMSDRDYFKYERELTAARDAAGYNHLPLGSFSAGLHDLKIGGPEWHPDRTALKALAPTPHHTIDWAGQAPAYPNWADPYWFQSTAQARDQVAQDFDRNVAVNFNRSQVPFRTAASFSTSILAPWIIHPQTGEQVTGTPGTSLMQHIKTSLGHPDVQSVWNGEYQLGKA